MYSLHPGRSGFLPAKRHGGPNKMARRVLKLGRFWLPPLVGIPNPARRDVMLGDYDEPDHDPETEFGGGRSGWSD